MIRDWTRDAMYLEIARQALDLEFFSPSEIHAIHREPPFEEGDFLLMYRSPRLSTSTEQVQIPVFRRLYGQMHTDAFEPQGCRKPGVRIVKVLRMEHQVNAKKYPGAHCLFLQLESWYSIPKQWAFSIKSRSTTQVWPDKVRGAQNRAVWEFNFTQRTTPSIVAKFRTPPLRFFTECGTALLMNGHRGTSPLPHLLRCFMHEEELEKPYVRATLEQFLESDDIDLSTLRNLTPA